MKNTCAYNSRVEITIFLMEKISFSLKLFFNHFYGQSFIKTVRGPSVMWVLKRTVSLTVTVSMSGSFEHQKQMFKLMDKKMITILHLKYLHIWTYPLKQRR